LFNAAIIQELKVEFPWATGLAGCADYTMMRKMKVFSPPDIDIGISLDRHRHTVLIHKTRAQLLDVDLKPRNQASIWLDVTLFYYFRINENV
jgi:hypothetical protein